MVMPTKLDPDDILKEIECSNGIRHANLARKLGAKSTSLQYTIAKLVDSKLIVMNRAKQHKEYYTTEYYARHFAEINSDERLTDEQKHDRNVLLFAPVMRSRWVNSSSLSRIEFGR